MLINTLNPTTFAILPALMTCKGMNIEVLISLLKTKIGTNDPGALLNLLPKAKDPASLLQVIETNVLAPNKLDTLLQDNPGKTGPELRLAAAKQLLSQAEDKLDGNMLLLLLEEKLAEARYLETFQTNDEKGKGGDTDEYKVCLWDESLKQYNSYAYWVIHIHRSRGQSSKGESSAAAHIKTFADRKKKDASRWSISSKVVGLCRQ
jgi:hypothetical protein